jgi:NADP-dependent 3-hydroxy acid dehydrogenase YdfG
MAKNTWFITGASSGFSLAFAKYAACGTCH